MEKINLVYIDDKIDLNLSKYLCSYTQNDISIVYSEVIFDIHGGYESLIRDSRVREANVIFIDSRLFQNDKASKGKYTGEQFKLILKKIFPYIEVIVITQNEITGDFSSTVSKHDPQNGTNANDYYSDKLPRYIQSAIKNVREYREIRSNIEAASEMSILIEKINNSLEGIDTYDELKKEDIDAVIDIFKRLQETING